MSRLEEVANVVLRVPYVLLLDLLYRWDVGETPHPAYGVPSLHPDLLWGLYCLAHVVCVALMLLPLRHLVDVYLYLLTALLLYVAHHTTREYLCQEAGSHHTGALYEDQTSLTRSVSTLTGLVMLCTLCALLMRRRQAWLFSAPVLPLLARLAGLPLHSLPLISALSSGLTLAVMVYVALSGLGALRRLLSKAYHELTQEMELYRLVALSMALWTQLAISTLFLVFWLVLYFLHIFKTLSSKPELLEHQGAVFILLNSVSECCGTPYCLLGLTCTVSYMALGMLNLCKFYLAGFAAFQNGNVMHRGVTEGVTLMLLSLQTGLLEMQVLQRTFLLSIIFFIVVTSTLQSMIEIADPILLALAATRNRSVWRHVRALSLCLFLLFFPCYMAYKIAYFFHMDFWLLILVSSCLLTSLQVLGTLFIYSLFMIELFQDSRVERMDEIIYGVNAISRVLEFLVALCVVAYGMWESMFGEWSWMGVSVIIVHSYFNVWLRAQSGWRSFLLRRKAAKMIGSLPMAMEEQLRAHNDVCSICFQEMSTAVVTTCGHIFHPDCLKKWLYVQDTCPLCHQSVRAEDRDADEEDDEDLEIQATGDSGPLLGGRLGSGEESMEDSKQGDLSIKAETETFVGKNVPQIKETSCLEADGVPGRLVEQAVYTQIEEVLLGSEQVEVICAKKQEGNSSRQKDAQYIGEQEVQRQEAVRSESQENEDPVREVICNEEEQEQTEVFFREPEKPIPKQKYQWLFMEEHKKKALCGDKQRTVCHEEVEEGLDQEKQKSHMGQVLYKKDKEDICMKEQKSLHEQEVQVVYGVGEERECVYKETKGGHS
ncbi:RING finger protein 145-like [Gastrophryne carolinensis]